MAAILADNSQECKYLVECLTLRGLWTRSLWQYNPGPEDETGAAIKNTFASNMIQSAFDQQMAMQMAEFQAGIGTQNMETAANLELRNNSALMEQEFNSGMASMGAQFDTSKSIC